MSDSTQVLKSVQGVLGGVSGTDIPGTVRHALCRRIVVWPKPADDGSASTATAEVLVFRAPVAGKIVSAHLTATSGGVTANDTDYATVTVSKRDGAGGSATTIATYSSTVAGGGMTQWVPKALTVTEADATFAAGSIITVKITKPGSGVVVRAGALTLLVDEGV